MTPARLIIIVLLSTMHAYVCNAAESTATLSTSGATTNTATLLSLPALTSSDTEPGAPEKDPSLARDLDAITTSPVGPVIDLPTIYWGNVGDKRGYSLNDIMQVAWQANPNWSTYAANHAAAHAELVEACALPNPQVDMEYGSERSDTEGKSSIWSLGFSQPIELPGKRRARQAEALAGFPVVSGEIANYANLLRADVREAYWTIQYHSAVEQMYAAQESLTQKQYDLSLRRQELGDVGKIEVVNARVELLQSTREREAARRRKEGAKAALNALAGGKLGNNFKLGQDFSKGYKRHALSTSINIALATHPRLAQLAAQLEQKYASIQRQNTEWWPDLSLGARSSKEFDGDSAAITASIEVPLWNRNEGGIARAEAEAQKVYAEITIAYNELRRDVEVAYQNLMLAVEQIDSYENGLKGAAEEAVFLAWEQFNLGGGGYLDILMARRQLVELQQGYIQALYDAATANAKFEQAVGR